MTTLTPQPSIKTDPDHIVKVISFNVKMLLAAQGLNQSDLSRALNLTRSAMSYKLTGKTTWSVPDLINTANFLGTTATALMDDSLMRQMMGLRHGDTGAVTRPGRDESCSGREIPCAGVVCLLVLLAGAGSGAGLVGVGARVVSSVSVW